MSAASISVDWENFTPIASFIGGALIGVSASAFLILAGRIAGISGILDNVIRGQRASGLKLSFISGMLLVGTAMAPFCVDELDKVAHVSPTALALGGFLAGAGSARQHGCTSGHGVCGLSRMSPKSLVAVCVFMASAMATGTFIRPNLGLSAPTDTGALLEPYRQFSSALPPLLGLLGLAAATLHGSIANVLTGLGCGGLFSLGLGISGMANASKLLGFLDLFSGKWDPSLAFVMGGAVLTALGPFQYVVRQQRAKDCKPPCPVLFPNEPIGSFVQPCVWSTHTGKQDTIVGAALFGAGWSIASLCPGPGLFLAGAGSPATTLIFMPSMIAGMVLSKYW